MRSNISAGLLMFRRCTRGPEVLLVHPGGPYFRNKDDGAWTIPKGESAPGEELLRRAQIEFGEEVGIPPTPEADYLSLGTIKQKGGKTVHAWAFDGDLPAEFQLRSNTFELEWPPRSGRRANFPEVDQARFFAIDEAMRKINPAQRELLDRLVAIVA